MSVELIPVRPEQLADLARICHLAFNTLHERHRIHADVPTEEVGRQIMGAILPRADYHGVAAIENGRLIGSNFLLAADEVCGLGPITVDPAAQSKGVGRLLMEWAIAEARRRRGAAARIRLFQEAMNTTSLSLYTRVGFSWRDTAALMHPAPAQAEDKSIRAMTTGDLKQVEKLSSQTCGLSRGADAAALLAQGMPAFVRERGGRVLAYRFGTLLGHGAGETIEDLLDVASHAAREIPEPIAVVIVPLSQQALFQAALARGFRVAKLLNYMSFGEFEPAPGPSMPSIQC